MMGWLGLAAVLRLFPARVFVSVLGKRLAVASGVSSARSLAGTSAASLARSLAVVLSSGSHLGSVDPLSSQRSSCHHAGASRALVPTLLMVSELLGSRVAAMEALGELPRQGFLPGSRRPPRQGSCRGKPILLLGLLAPLSWRCSGSLVLRFPSSAVLGVPTCVALTAHAQVRGTNESPYICTPTGAPRPGPYISATRCWARPRTVRGQWGWILFTEVTPPVVALPHDLR